MAYRDNPNFANYDISQDRYISRATRNAPSHLDWDMWRKVGAPGQYSFPPGGATPFRGVTSGAGRPNYGITGETHYDMFKGLGEVAESLAGGAFNAGRAIQQGLKNRRERREGKDGGDGTIDSEESGTGASMRGAGRSQNLSITGGSSSRNMRRSGRGGGPTFADMSNQLGITMNQGSDVYGDNYGQVMGGISGTVNAPFQSGNIGGTFSTGPTTTGGPTPPTPPTPGGPGGPGGTGTPPPPPPPPPPTTTGGTTPTTTTPGTPPPGPGTPPPPGGTKPGTGGPITPTTPDVGIAPPAPTPSFVATDGPEMGGGTPRTPKPFGTSQDDDGDNWNIGFPTALQQEMQGRPQPIGPQQAIEGPRAIGPSQPRALGPGSPQVGRGRFRGQDSYMGIPTGNAGTLTARAGAKYRGDQSQALPQYSRLAQSSFATGSPTATTPSRGVTPPSPSKGPKPKPSKSKDFEANPKPPKKENPDGR